MTADARTRCHQNSFDGRKVGALTVGGRGFSVKENIRDQNDGISTMDFRGCPTTGIDHPNGDEYVDIYGAIFSKIHKLLDSIGSWHSWRNWTCVYSDTTIVKMVVVGFLF